MKRDLDLIRSILLRVEQLPIDETLHASSIEVPGHGEDEIVYNALLLHEIGYLKSVDASSNSGHDLIILGITFEGHDYLDAVRSEKVWSGTVKRIADAGVSVSLDVVKQVASKVASGLLGLS